jgi:hypothetical protein
MHYEIERLSMAGHWLNPGKAGRKYKLLSDARLGAAARAHA